MFIDHYLQQAKMQKSKRSDGEVDKGYGVYYTMEYYSVTKSNLAFVVTQKNTMK